MLVVFRLPAYEITCVRRRSKQTPKRRKRRDDGQAKEQSVDRERQRRHRSMSAYVFGKAMFCDQSNLSASRAYINSTLLTRGILHDAEAPLKFNSADAPAVINLLYDFLRKTEQDEAARENMSAKIRQISTENDRLIAHEVRHLFGCRVSANISEHSSQ